MMSHSEQRQFIEATHRHPSLPRIYCYGDSWFQYPFRPVDLQKQLERHYRRQCLFANDSAPGRESGEIKRRLPGMRSRLADWEIDILLLSMGGNDVVGSELREFLKPANEPQPAEVEPPPGTPQVVIDHVRLSAFRSTLNYLGDDFDRVLDARDQVAPACHVLINSYDYPFPDGRPFKKGPIVTKPWMKPYFEEVGLVEFARQRELSVWLIDQFFGATSLIANSRRGVTVVDSRGQLPRVAQWDNEIHPNGSGFRHIATTCWVPKIDPLI